MIHVGVDLHQRFCYMTAVDATGRQLKQGPVANEERALRRWLRGCDEPLTMAVEACSFWPAFKDAVQEEVQTLRLVHPQRVKAIASAKLKNDRVDSATLAHLSRCDLLPEAWMADLETREKRRQIGAMAASDPRAQWLATIPGIGVYSAMILLSEIGEVQRFGTAKSLYSYAGLVPWVRESAGHKSRGGITRCGSPRLRWVMVEAAHTAVRCSPAAKKYFERLKKRKHPHVARVALARKLLGAAYALLRDGACFDESIFAAV